MSDKTVIYVVGGYIPAGGTRMAYEIALVAHQDLGCQIKVVVVGDERPDGGVFDYPVHFDTVSFSALQDHLRPDDLLICNPSFSNGALGLKFDCKKLMYVQGFNTFSMLDLWFDRYVAVGGFVQEYLRTIYALEAPIIPPFIEALPEQTIPWRERPENSVVVMLKGDLQLQHLLLNRLKQEMESIRPSISARIDWERSTFYS